MESDWSCQLLVRCSINTFIAYRVQVLALEYNMEKPKQFVGLFGLFNIGMLMIIGLYMIIGVFGYLKFGDNIQASITLNLPFAEKLVSIL